MDFLPTLENMKPITIPEMKEIRLMNRVDTKFLANVDVLPALLEQIAAGYFVQTIGGNPISEYRTLYYDTADLQMYTVHQNQKLCRQKVRTRMYLNSDGLSFLEVKNKTNKGRTKKERIRIGVSSYGNLHDNEEIFSFLQEKSKTDQRLLLPQVENHFHRITLVNYAKTERLTIDYGIEFRNHQTGNEGGMPKLMIIELKQDGLQPSFFRDVLFEKRIKPIGISKYCLGTMLTNEGVKKNRFKKKLIYLNKIL